MLPSSICPSYCNWKCDKTYLRIENSHETLPQRKSWYVGNEKYESWVPICLFVFENFICRFWWGRNLPVDQLLNTWKWKWLIFSFCVLNTITTLRNMYFSFSVMCSFSGNDSSLDVYCLFFVSLSLKMPNICLKIIGVVDVLPSSLKKHLNQFLF